VLLESLKMSVVELLFVPVVLGEKLVESAFAGRTSRAMPATGFVAGRNKACGVGFERMLLLR
jgi:hypothetical protein